MAYIEVKLSEEDMVDINFHEWLTDKDIDINESYTVYRDPVSAHMIFRQDTKYLLRNKTYIGNEDFYEKKYNCAKFCWEVV